jgi:Kef-type K+ transport system membrane component KefB
MNALTTGQFGVELFLFVLGLELDVSAFAAGPTARLSATVAIVLTVVLVIGTLTHLHLKMLQGLNFECLL